MAAVRIQRWAIALSAYNYNSKCRPGLQNSNAGFFSIYPSKEVEEEGSFVKIYY